ncbi:MAG TPA: hypothetical protein VE623_16410 [Acidimicrobiales bacterium]|jgi:hypothetical protein|nr:hypothetical protein [Acidimicrobiales bacterium]
MITEANHLGTDIELRYRCAKPGGFAGCGRRAVDKVAHHTSAERHDTGAPHPYRR